MKLGWVEEWDDEQELFLITFIDEEPSELLNQPGEYTPFHLIEEFRVSTTQTKSHPGQKQFNFLVFERYGDRCAIFDIDTPEILQAAHLYPRRLDGSNDPRNGLVLCGNHHLALDAGLFRIDPETLDICFRLDGPDSHLLRITRENII